MGEAYDSGVSACLHATRGGFAWPAPWVGATRHSTHFPCLSSSAARASSSVASGHTDLISASCEEGKQRVGGAAARQHRRKRVSVLGRIHAAVAGRRARRRLAAAPVLCRSNPPDSCRPRGVPGWDRRPRALRASCRRSFSWLMACCRATRWAMMLCSSAVSARPSSSRNKSSVLGSGQCVARAAGRTSARVRRRAGQAGRRAGPGGAGREHNAPVGGNLVALQHQLADAGPLAATCGAHGCRHVHSAPGRRFEVMTSAKRAAKFCLPCAAMSVAMSLTPLRAAPLVPAGPRASSAAAPVATRRLSSVSAMCGDSTVVAPATNRAPHRAVSASRRAVCVTASNTVADSGLSKLDASRWVSSPPPPRTGFSAPRADLCSARPFSPGDRRDAQQPVHPHGRYRCDYRPV